WDVKERSGPGAPRRGTGTCQLAAEQGIDHSGFADIRSSQERHFWQARRRELIGVGSCDYELGQDSHGKKHVTRVDLANSCRQSSQAERVLVVHVRFLHRLELMPEI